MAPEAFAGPQVISLKCFYYEQKRITTCQRPLLPVPSRKAKRKIGKYVSAELKNCARCGQSFQSDQNPPGSCRYHGDILGNAQPLNLYEDHHFDDPALTNIKGPRYGRRWACCQDTDPDAPPCKSGVHVTYDCPAERWTEALKFEVK